MFGVLASIALTVSGVNSAMLLSEAERLAAEETREALVCHAQVEGMAQAEVETLDL
jgi:hypothetical protein